MVKKICLVPECERPSQGRGLCKLHHSHFMRGKDVGVQPVLARRLNGSGGLRLGYVVHGTKLQHGREHRLIAEKALGRKLKPAEVVHHVNENRADNRPENLVICPDRNYHMLIHARQRAMDACGNPDWRKCSYCGVYDPIEKLYASNKRKTGFYHVPCRNTYRQNKRMEDKCKPSA